MKNRKLKSSKSSLAKSKSVDFKSFGKSFVISSKKSKKQIIMEREEIIRNQRLFESQNYHQQYFKKIARGQRRKDLLHLKELKNAQIQTQHFREERKLKRVQEKGYKVLKNQIIPNNKNSIKPTKIQFTGPNIATSNINVGFVSPRNLSKTAYDTKFNDEESISHFLLNEQENHLTEKLISSSHVREKIQELLGEELFKEMSTLLS